MNADQVGGIVRAIAAALGGWLVGQGILDSATATTVAGALATIAVAVWSVHSNKTKTP